MTAKTKPRKTRSKIELERCYEALCVAVADGMPAGEAWNVHVAEGRHSKSVSDSKASTLLKVGGKWRARVESLRAETQRIADENRFLSKAEALKFLADTVRTPIGDVDHTSPLAQERTYIVGREEDSVKIKMAGKLDAIKQAAVMCGWNAPEKHTVTVDTHEAVEAALSNIFEKRGSKKT